MTKKTGRAALPFAGTDGDKSVFLLRIMAWIGAGAAALVALLRVALTPAWMDEDTGLIAAGGWLVAVVCLLLAVLAMLSLAQKPERTEIGGGSAIGLACMLMAAGGVGVLIGVRDIWTWLFDRVAPPPAMTVATPLGTGALWLQMLFGLLGGAALLRLGLVLAAEGSTRRGMAGWSMLAPVLWIWFRMARYEMSYVSTVRISQSFFDFMMFIAEMFFLMKLARYVAGIGKVSRGSLQFYAAATAVLAISAPITRCCMFFMQDVPAYEASSMSGLLDLLIGLLALTVLFSVAYGRHSEPAPAQDEQEPEESSSEDASEGEPSDEPSEEEPSSETEPSAETAPESTGYTAE